jgi:hypothetical protein
MSYLCCAGVKKDSTTNTQTENRDYVYDTTRYIDRRVTDWSARDDAAMYSENLRVATLIAWPSEKPKPSDMAARGFFYKGNQECRVTCAFCGINFDGWSELHELMQLHRTLVPACKGVDGKYGNIPISNQIELSWEVKDNPVNEASTSSSVPAVSLHRSTQKLVKALPDFYSSEYHRLNTFIKYEWHRKTPDKEELARKGFYLLKGGFVRCAYCTGRIFHQNKLVLIDFDIDLAHASVSPACSFLRRPEQCYNITIKSGTLHPFPEEEIHRCRNSVAQEIIDNYRDIQQIEDVIQGDKDNHGNHRFLPPPNPLQHRNPYMSVAAARTRTYNNHPPFQVDVSDLVASGLYYTGVGDFVRCYSCGGGLNCWKFKENPWIRHAQFYPECMHVKHHKGKEFVEMRQLEIVEISKGLPQRKRKREEASQMDCRNCLRKADILFISCGHVSACNKCQKDMAVCPQCKRRSDIKLRIFL